MPKSDEHEGDNGYTGILGEKRVPKYHPRIEAVGMVDEANAALGLARALCKAEFTRQVLLKVQRDLYHLMSEIAATPENATRFRVINNECVVWLDKQIHEVSVEMPRDFILPGDSLAGAALSLARTIIRRAERQVARLLLEGYIQNSHLLRYLNRLSSLCFALELLENKEAGQERPSLAKE